MNRYELEKLRQEGEEKRQRDAEELGMFSPKPPVRVYGYCVKCGKRLEVLAWKYCEQCGK